ncbi:transcriptional regulator, partial [Smithella sp. SCADC]
MNTQLKEVAKVWPSIQSVFSVPHNERDYNKLVNMLDSLIDEVGNNASHPLSRLM